MQCSNKNKANDTHIVIFCAILSSATYVIFAIFAIITLKYDNIGIVGFVFISTLHIWGLKSILSSFCWIYGLKRLIEDLYIVNTLFTGILVEPLFASKFRTSKTLD